MSTDAKYFFIGLKCVPVKYNFCFHGLVQKCWTEKLKTTPRTFSASSLPFFCISRYQALQILAGEDM